MSHDDTQNLPYNHRTTEAEEALSPPDSGNRALLDLLDGVAVGGPSGDAAASLGGFEDTLEGVDRASLETLGLLATSLPPTVPPVRLKEGLFARLDLDGSAAGGRSEAPPMAVLPWRRRMDRSPGWASLALAAAVLLAVGLGGWSGYLFSELQQSRKVVATLSSELDRRTAEALPADYQRVVYENERLRQQIGVVTERDTRVCALATMTPDQPEAAGTMFLLPEKHRWVLAASNLAKCELGRRYRVWFMDGEGRFTGGEVLEHINGEDEVELASGELPDGTRAILLTLEFPDRFGDQPAGDRVLFGDRAVELY